MTNLPDPLDSPGPFTFGKESKKALSTVHPKLRLLCFTVIRICNVSIREGHRGKEEQNEHFREGRSTLKFPESKHNKMPSEAVHILPYPVDWSNKLKSIARFYYLAGIVDAVSHFLGIEIRWGGDWDSDLDFTDQNFDDLGHYELLNPDG